MTSGCWLAWPAAAIKPYKEGTPGFKVKISEISTLVALMDFGNFVTPIPSSYVMNAIGRKLTLFATAMLYIAASICGLVAYNVIWLYFARIFAGLAKGIAFTVIPIYLAEVANIEIRGALSTMFIGFLNFGMFYDYALGPFMELTPLDIANLAVPLVFTAGFFFFPESPYYLLMKGKVASARKSLVSYRQVRKNDTSANTLLDNEFTRMQATVENDMKNKARFVDLFLTASSRRALLIISALALFQRASGISPTIAYSTEIMPKKGGGLSSNVYLILFSFVLLIANYAALPLIDYWGRKPLLIVSSVTTALTTLTASVYYYLERETNVDVTNIQWIPYACLLIFATTYSIGIGFIPSTLVGELFPTNVKCYAGSISAIILAATSFSMNKLFYEVSMFYGPHYMYWFFTTACVGCCIFTIFLVFETKGKSFDEIQDILHQIVDRQRPKAQKTSTKD
ncbi:facilitated trehalose transporter Tret1-like isoform X3 [Rhodnius prolixus]